MASQSLEALRQVEKLEGLRAVVLGLARSGRSAAELLHRRGALVVGIEEGTHAAETLEGEWAREHLREAHRHAEIQHLDGAAFVILSPGIPRTHRLVQAALDRGIPVWSEIELAYRSSQSRVIAITGSKGKSTTATLAGHILTHLGIANVVAGNIGLPYSAVVEKLQVGDWVVLELSSFQLESIESFHAEVAVQLQISADHLDRYPDLDSYAAAKARIVQHQTRQDLLVVDPQDPYGMQLAQQSVARVVGFGHTWRGNGVVQDGEQWIWQTAEEREVLARVDDLQLLGEHNRGNTMAALAICRGLGLWREEGRQALRSFRGLPYRMQPCGEIDSIRIINDAKSTTVEAVRAAVRGVGGPCVLALGGRNKGLDFGALRADLGGVRLVLVYGEDATQIARQLQGAARIEQVADLDAILQRALELGTPGDTLLFSPGCTSFDMFQDAEERGRAFEMAVRRAVQERSR